MQIKRTTIMQTDTRQLLIAAVSPDGKVADVARNAQAITREIQKAEAAGVDLVVFPELALTGYTAADLFFQPLLIQAAEDALAIIMKETATCKITAVIGMPVRVDSYLFNAGVVIAQGSVLGIVPKREISSYYEQRYFTAAEGVFIEDLNFAGQKVPMSPDLVFYDEHEDGQNFAVEVGMPRCLHGSDEEHGCCSRASSEEGEQECCGHHEGEQGCCGHHEDEQGCCGHHADEHGRNDKAEDAHDHTCCSSHNRDVSLIVVPAACSELIDVTQDSVNQLIRKSARKHVTYVVASAGRVESTQDAVFSGRCLIVEDGKVLAESAPFEYAPTEALVGLQRPTLDSEKEKDQSASASRAHEIFGITPHAAPGVTLDPIPRPTSNPTPDTTSDPTPNPMPDTTPNPTPFVPHTEEEIAERTHAVLAIQANGLAQRMKSIGCTKLVLGISGGLDSTLALMASLKAVSLLGIDPQNITAVSMPGFGTSTTTHSNAQLLADACGVTYKEINITQAAKNHLEDINHISTNDRVYENAQARERTQILMDLANAERAIMVGTGDLSEIALGWSTYNGDHMSMYAVNADVPKTLIQAMIVSIAKDDATPQQLKTVLHSISATPISPELLAGEGEFGQKTEDILGPYKAHDFFLFHAIGKREEPQRILALAQKAFPEYTKSQLIGWLRTFYQRFFANQFKRSCSPDGPQIMEIDLSPRGPWCMPSDAPAALWLNTLKES